MISVINRLQKLVGKEIWVQTAGGVQQGELLSINADSGEFRMSSDNACYSDVFIYAEKVEQIMIYKR